MPHCDRSPNDAILGCASRKGGTADAARLDTDTGGIPWLHHTRLAGLGVIAARFCFPGRPTVCVRLAVLMTVPRARAISCCSSRAAWLAQTSSPAGACVGNAGYYFMAPARPAVHARRAGGTRFPGVQTSLCKLTTDRRHQTSKAGDGVRVAKPYFML